MKILHLVSYYVFSGPLAPTTALACGLRERGHDVWIAFDSKRRAPNDFEEPAEPRVRNTGLEVLPLALSTKSTPREMLEDRHALRRFVQDTAPDVIHFHTSHDHSLGALSLPKKRPPVRVRTFHSSRSLELRLGQKWLNRRVDGYVVRSEHHAQCLKERFSVGHRPVAVIPGSMDAEAFQRAGPEARARARQRFGIPEDARVVGQVALIAGRGQEELAGAAVKVNSESLHLLYVGRGESEEALRMVVQAAGLGSKAHFAGYLQGAELHDAYAAMDAAFIARPGNDASARAALEAMASGVVPIVVPVDALAETVTEDRGYLATECTPTSIAEALRTWLDDSGASDKAQRARTYIMEERNIEREVNACLELYRRCLP